MDNDRYYQLGSYDKLFNQIDELTDALASRDAEIKSLRQQLADSQKKVTLLRGRLLASANYIDALGGNSFDPRRTLAATELHDRS